ncbi:MAG: hypothetical protein K2N31_01590 [Treponemataceae bacterium]|nr:hypothetical protein [Treponemataceae bacterium]
MRKIVKPLIFVAIIGCVVYSCGKKIVNNAIIDHVRDECFWEVADDISIGGLFYACCSDGKWEFKPSKTKATRWGAVTYTGKLNGKPLKVMFSLYLISGDFRYTLDGFSFNGEVFSRSKNPDKVEAFPYAMYAEYLKRID